MPDRAAGERRQARRAARSCSGPAPRRPPRTGRRRASLAARRRAGSRSRPEAEERPAPEPLALLGRLEQEATGPSPRSLRYAETGVSQSSMKVWRSGTSVCSRASSRTSSSDGVSSRSAATAIQHLERVAELQRRARRAARRGGRARPRPPRRRARRTRRAPRARPPPPPPAPSRRSARGSASSSRRVARPRARVAPLLDRPLERGQRLGRDRLELAVVEAGALAGVARRARPARRARGPRPRRSRSAAPSGAGRCPRSRPCATAPGASGDQNHISPVSRVRASASSFMYASVSTSPVRESWTMQGKSSTARLWYGVAAVIGTFRNSYVAPISSKPRLPVELLGPVGGVGDHEDLLGALGRGRVGRRGHRRAGVAAPAARLQRAHLVHLREPVVHVQAAGAGGVVRGRGEVARARAPRS